MNPRNFDREFDVMRRRHARLRRVTVTFIIISWTLIIGAAGWILTHPENVGGFIGRIVSGFSAQASAPHPSACASCAEIITSVEKGWRA